MTCSSASSTPSTVGGKNQHNCIHDKALHVKGRAPTCGKILAHAKRQVAAFRQRMGNEVCVFKIGVTADPHVRFQDYLEKNYSTMWLISESNDLGMTHMLEAALVSDCSGIKGCRNHPETGGEGSLHRSDPPFYVYLVGARADTFKSIR